MERDGNGIEGIIESGVMNAAVTRVEEGQAGVLPFPLAMNELLRMGLNVMLLLLRTVVEEFVESLSLIPSQLKVRVRECILNE
jgi:hypothetical protein